MTALATISDQSTIADGVRGWLFVLAVIFIGGAVLTVIACRHGLTNVPVMGDELSTLDHLDRHTCAMAHCPYPGTIARLHTADHGAKTTWVCPGHSDEGDVKAWWVA